jgi:hypothetical protein
MYSSKDHCVLNSCPHRHTKQYMEESFLHEHLFTQSFLHLQDTNSLQVVDASGRVVQLGSYVLSSASSSLRIMSNPIWLKKATQDLVPESATKRGFLGTVPAWYVAPKPPLLVGLLLLPTNRGGFGMAVPVRFNPSLPSQVLLPCLRRVESSLPPVYRAGCAPRPVRRAPLGSSLSLEGVL